ncbi:MAG: hypothetical protein ABW169_03920 [Sphingobium sp.]
MSGIRGAQAMAAGRSSGGALRPLRAGRRAQVRILDIDKWKEQAGV